MEASGDDVPENTVATRDRPGVAAASADDDARTNRDQRKHGHG
jgi:hypothetical protein